MRHFIDEQINSRNENFDFKSLIKLILVILVFFFIALYNQIKHNQLLNNYGMAKAIVINASYKDVYVKFMIKNNVVYSKGTGHYENYSYLNEGDTVLIKYSLEQPQVVEIIECFWNEKSKKILHDFKFKTKNSSSLNN